MSEEKTFARDIGQKARVERHTEQGEPVLRANQALREAASLIQGGNLSLKEAEYWGSVAVHIWKFPSLGEIVFVSQTGTIGETPEQTASAAFEALRGDLMEQYGRQRKKRRSGF